MDPHSTTYHVYLSPHLDDGVFSCGGMIHQQVQNGERVVVISLCAGQPGEEQVPPFAAELHARWGVSAASVAQQRSAEDLAALGLLGAEAVHLPFLDCIYRLDPATGRAFYDSEANLFGNLAAYDLSKLDQVATLLSMALSPLGLTRVYAPLALGHHVDHQLTRLAAERLGTPFAYYEDYPYADPEAKLSSFCRKTGRETDGLFVELVALSEASLDAKCRAMALYTSQISSFWDDGVSAIHASMRRFMLYTGGWAQLAERLWRPPSCE